MTSDSLFSAMRSTIEGLVWPAIPDQTGRQLQALLWQLERTQYWDAGQLRRAQLEQLDQLLGYAFKTSPFYQQRLREINYRPDKPLQETCWQQLPFLSRNELLTHAGEIMTRRYPKEHGRGLKIHTAGTMGRPVTMVHTELSRTYLNGMILREHHWHGRQCAGRLAMIRHLPNDAQANSGDGRRLDNWGQPIESLYVSGEAWVMHIGQPTDRQLRWLQRIRPRYLHSYPSNLLALARQARDSDIQLPDLKQVISMSEPLQPEVRATIEAVFGVPVHAIYAVSEVGNLAGQCAEGSCYHVNSEQVLLEILNNEGEPCAPGEVGRVVVTDLHNFATPLIRYDVGDLATFGQTCSCGRGLPVIEQVYGRLRNQVCLPTGEQFCPDLSLAATSTAAGQQLQAFQCVQTGLQEIDVYLLTQGRLAKDQVKQLTDYLVKQLKYPFQMNVHYVQQLPFSKTGRVEWFVSQLLSSPDET